MKTKINLDIINNNLMPLKLYYSVMDVYFTENTNELKRIGSLRKDISNMEEKSGIWELSIDDLGKSLDLLNFHVYLKKSLIIDSIKNTTTEQIDGLVITKLQNVDLKKLSDLIVN